MIDQRTAKITIIQMAMERMFSKLKKAGLGFLALLGTGTFYQELRCQSTGVEPLTWFKYVFQLNN